MQPSCQKHWWIRLCAGAARCSGLTGAFVPSYANDHSSSDTAVTPLRFIRNNHMSGIWRSWCWSMLCGSGGIWGYTGEKGRVSLFTRHSDLSVAANTKQCTHTTPCWGLWVFYFVPSFFSFIAQRRHRALRMYVNETVILQSIMGNRHTCLICLHLYYGACKCWNLHQSKSGRNVCWCKPGLKFQL